MTENENSPENLRKFLESEDPAMRRMGLSMAKGSGVPENLQKNIFGLALWDPEKENLESAREIVEHIGLDNIKELPPWWHPFTNLHGHGAQETLIQCSAVWNMGLMKKKQIELMLIEILKEHDNIGRYDYRKIAIAILGNIKSKKSVDTLIEILNKIKKYADVQSWVNDEIKEIIRSLGLINNRKSRNALIDLIKYEPKNPIYSNGDGKYYSPGIDEDIKMDARHALIYTQNKEYINWIIKSGEWDSQLFSEMVTLDIDEVMKVSEECIDSPLLGNWNIRTELAHALQHVDDIRAFRLLKKEISLFDPEAMSATLVSDAIESLLLLDKNRSFDIEEDISQFLKKDVLKRVLKDKLLNTKGDKKTLIARLKKRYKEIDESRGPVLKSGPRIFWGNWLLAKNIFRYTWMKNMINWPTMNFRWTSLLD